MYDKIITNQLAVIIFWEARRLSQGELLRRKYGKPGHGCCISEFRARRVAEPVALAVQSVLASEDSEEIANLAREPHHQSTAENDSAFLISNGKTLRRAMTATTSRRSPHIRPQHPRFRMHKVDTCQ